MANKCICDRCKKTICENSNNPFSSLANSFTKHLYLKETVPFSDAVNIDLCEECEKDLYKWLHCELGESENAVKTLSEDLEEAKERNTDLLRMLDETDAKYCLLAKENDRLEKENTLLCQNTVKELLGKMHISFKLNFDEDN